MGVHFVHPDEVGDDAIHPERPELLVFEPRNGRLRLAGVEYLVDVAKGTPPTSRTGRP